MSYIHIYVCRYTNYFRNIVKKSESTYCDSIAMSQLGIVELPDQIHHKIVRDMWPSVWANETTVFLAIVDDAYLDHALLLIHSLIRFGYTRNDFHFACVSNGCAALMSKLHIQYSSYTTPNCTSIRCAISSTKFLSILHLLETHRSIYVCDLDVYFLKDPLKHVIPRSEDIIVVQMDFYTKYNFGHFLVRSSATSIELFKNISNEFKITAKWDQKIFSSHLALIPNLMTVFQPHTFLNYMEILIHPDPAERTLVPSSVNLVTVHMTCVEGAQTKKYWAFNSFTNFDYAEFHTKRLTVSAQYFESQLVTEQDHLVFINTLAMIAKATGRGIRLFGAERLHSIFSVDRLYQDNIVMVPANWWKFSTKAHSIVQYALTDSNDLRSLLEISKRRSNVGEIHLNFRPSYFIAVQPSLPRHKYTCILRKVVREQGLICAKTCDGIEW